MCRNKLSEAQHECIIGTHLSSIRQNIISVQLNISTSIINDTIKRYKETGSAAPKKRPGHPKILFQYDTQTLQCIIHINQFSPLGNIMDKLNSNLNTTLHNNTIRRYLHDMDLGSYSTHKKPLLTEK